MAYVTRNPGFGVTCAVSYEYPYTLARRFSTLDHLTGGRIAGTSSPDERTERAPPHCGCAKGLIRLGCGERIGAQLIACETRREFA
jgi:hypothetical protein